MAFASRALVDGGRLAFLLPIDLESQDPQRHLQATASHPGRSGACISRVDVTHVFGVAPADLELVSASLQYLAGGMGRFLVTMVRKAKHALSGPACPHELDCSVS